MQLSCELPVKGAIAALTAVLLGGTAVKAATAGDRVESSILIYNETDRVIAGEGIFSYAHNLAHDRKLNLRLTLDGLTGASPNGATPSRQIQTFTSPSGQGSYKVAANEIPLDDTFRDVRYSGDVSLSSPLNPVTTAIYGLHLSAEQDYTSFGGNVGLTRDFDRKNRTLALSLAYAHDLVRPMGGAPVPLASMPLAVEPEDNSGGESEDDDDHEGDEGASEGKDVFDLVAGFTQVINRNTVTRFNYSLSHAVGYLNDPYKIVSVVQNPAGAAPGEPVSYLFESRPDNHTKHAVFGELRRYISGHTVDISYRYFWDNWGITSHTIDFRYRLPLPSNHALQPHLRWYKQREADFYQSYLLDNAATPTHISSDYRLAAFTGLTLGLQYFLPVAEKMHLSIGAEYYTQRGDLSPPKSLGILSEHELFPKLDAMMVRIGFSYDL